MRENKSVILWLLSGCFLILSMVVIGGVTRLTDSGLSMVDWNLVEGAIPPLNQTDWLELFNKYKQTIQNSSASSNNNSLTSKAPSKLAPINNKKNLD